MEPKTSYISFSAEINVSTVEQLLGVVFGQLHVGAERIYLLFSTSGGQVDPGVALYNTLNGLPVPLVIHNVGNVDSTGNAVFMAGKERVASPHSTFLYHGVKWGFGAGAHLGPAELREITLNLSAAESKISGIVSEKTSLKLEEVNGFFAQAHSVNSAEALARGIVHRVEDVRIPPGIQPIQLVFPR